jgi:spore coat protein A
MKPSKAFFLLALATSLIDVAVADAIVKGLMDPDGQPKFEVPVAEALAITFKIILPNGTLSLNAYSIKQATGLKDPYGKPLMTPVFGYGVSARKASWPGPTLEATNSIKSIIQWGNNLVNITSHPFTSLANLSVVDPTLHWAYSLPGYDGYNFKRNGIPTVTHLHGSHSDPNMDGYPESFYTPNWAIMGPAWKFKKYLYPNNQPATTLWYHDHALGITRLNVYSGLAGFYIIRDNFDTGRQDNRQATTKRHMPSRIACSRQMESSSIPHTRVSQTTMISSKAPSGIRIVPTILLLSPSSLEILCW